MDKPKKLLILGSGALKIGEAGEFDYSGSQCIKAIKEEGIKTVLVNPNIATIQTSDNLADKVYFLPVNPYFVEKVIEKEKPDGILLSFGGQTALNCGVKLHETGVLKKHNVKVFGTPVKSIVDTEDRELFVKKLDEIGVKVPKSKAVHNVKDALKVAEEIGYPIIIRAAYTLGGLGSSVCFDKKELENNAKEAFSYTDQILIEEYIKGWKELEYEVVRDSCDNCITVCNMENFDPLGIHTGESIVVAPSQTLTNDEYHKLRELSIRVIRHVGIVGECNIQFALDPESDDYRVIEVNARLSRSSALASKATGYPLAFVAAKLALGYALPELSNSITKSTTACFEPALDYIVVKIPRWDLKKFRKVSKKLGSGMKSVGEVMAIGRKFEEVLQKAIRMLNIGMKGVVCNEITFKDLDSELKNPTDERVFAVAEAMKKGYSVEKINKLTGIDKWFLYKMERIVWMENKLKEKALDKEILLSAKKIGFSDYQIGMITEKSELQIRELRKENKIVPCIKQIDTLGAEYPAKTNYLYVTYNGYEDDVDYKEKKIIVLGSGAYSIGSSVEFDWCCVNAVNTLRKHGHKTIMINYNPETVSTDYDECDRLYFDELSFETVMDIYDKEEAEGIILSMGGQIPNNLAMKLDRAGAKIFGTSAKNIDNAEDRNKFSSLLDSLGIDQPEWNELTSVKEAKEFAKKVGFPVIVRPSYVLSGAAMNIAFEEKDLENFLSKAVNINKEHPVVISKFITNAREIEIDAVANKGKLVVWAITEHVENAGVHSGDATMVLPPQKTYLETIRRVEKIAEQTAESLQITGPFNIQFLAKENQIKVIECNLRASRSFPFVSKVLKKNFVEIAVNAMMKKETMFIGFPMPRYVGVKAPQFSFTRLKGADPILSVEMASTGEVACLGEDQNEAFLKSIISTGFKIPEKNVLLSIGGDENKYKFLGSAKKLRKMGFNIFATDKTSKVLSEKGIENTRLYKVSENKQPNIIDHLTNSKLDMVINIPSHFTQKEIGDAYAIRRAAVDFSIPLITNRQVAELFVDAISKKKIEDLEIKSWDEY
ncbi:MAG: carbamoyl-phosphate synthase (glutamine-hydrolyzing) large subunit [bacterium]|nr:carbamoyl-phosphate synthase (glutamine-hydrolyzing) large subunit [bacterium]